MLDEIVDWVETKPRFWQKAIQLLILNNTLSQADIDEIRRICKIENGLLKGTFPLVDFIALRGHIHSISTGHNVRLSRIHSVSNINALSSKSTLEFSIDGLTVVYGDNGSGKSSYGSILKHLCTTRGQKPALNGNLYKPSTVSISKKADLEYTEDGTTFTTVTFDNGNASDPNLKKISFFDTESARHYIKSEAEIAFIPTGLSLIEKFANCLTNIEADISREKTSLAGNHLNLSLFNINPVTKAGQLINNLSSKTQRGDLWQTAQWDLQKESRITEIKDRIAALKVEDPSIKRRLQTETSNRLRTLDKRLEELNSLLLSESTVKEIEQAIRKLETAQQTAMLSSSEAFSTLPFVGIGGNAWKLLWESARKFYNEGSGKNSFPDTSNLNNCPLCLQTLGSDSKTQLNEFERFVQNDAQTSLEKAKVTLELIQEKIIKSEISLQPYDTTIAEIETQKPGFRKEMDKYLEALRLAKEQLLKNIEVGQHTHMLVIQPSDSARVTLQTLIADLDTSNLSADNEKPDEELKLLNLELLELQDTKIMHTVYPQIGREIFRKKKIELLEKCVSQCNTRLSTVLSNDLADDYVTKGLKDKLQEEITKLGFKNVKVEAATKGVKGKQYHYLKLDEPNAMSVNLSDILSEGEHRCLALATFLSELSLSDHASAIVFDDPVSSLDHKWKNRIARRLVEESKVRQVVIFTHDITFLLFLEEETNRSAQNITITSLTRKAQETGIILKNPPWDAQGVKARIGQLKDAQATLAKVEKNETEEKYREMLQPLYGKLRETWERAIEEVVLNDVIKRFGREIQTKKLEKVIDLTAQDYSVVDENMSKCSKYFFGHDSASGLNESVPDAAEFLADVIVLENAVKDIRARRK